MTDTGAKHSAGAQFQTGGKGELTKAVLGSSQRERRFNQKWSIRLDLYFDFE